LTPIVAFRCRVGQLRELRRNPVRQRGYAGTARYRPRHAGRGKELAGRSMRLLKLFHLAGMPSAMGELEADALAVPAGRENGGP